MYKRIYRLLTGNPYWLESLIDKHRLQFLSMLAVKSALETKGGVLELGVYRGGSLYAIMKALKREGLHNKVFGLDTFKGLPIGERWKNSHRLNHNNFLRVTNEFSKRKLYPQLISGEFEYTLKESEELKNETFCFVHFDCDLYDSYDIGLKFVLPRLNQKGIIFFDDYNSKYATRSNEAIHKHIAKEKLIILPNKQAYYQKQND